MCSLYTARRELRRSGALVALQPQVLDLLKHLIRNRERLASKDDLLAIVWNGRIVSEATLSTRINAAPTALGDSSEEQRLIRTAHRILKFHRTDFRASQTNSNLAIPHL
jgi:DNA-binding winged helix-turn-helix (wHTH) protein